MRPFNTFPDKPDWAKYIDSLTEEEQKKHWESLNYDEECVCDNDTITPSGFCTDCWKYKLNWKYQWTIPRKEGDRWLLLDRKMYDHLCPYVAETRCNTWESMRLYFYDKQKGICPVCKNKFILCDMRLHHKLSRNQGGFEFYDNMTMLCLKCHFETYKEARES